LLCVTISAEKQTAPEQMRNIRKFRK